MQVVGTVCWCIGQCMGCWCDLLMQFGSEVLLVQVVGACFGAVSQVVCESCQCCFVGSD